MKKKVFIVHGHDKSMLKTVKDYLKFIGFDAVVLSDYPSKGDTVYEKFKKIASEVDYAVVLYSPDDEGKEIRDKDLLPRVRENVMLELGYFIAKLENKVVVLKKDPKDKTPFSLPSDLKGLVTIPYTRGWKDNLIKELIG